MRLNKDVKAQLLRSLPTFAGCDESDLHAISSASDELDLRAGKVVATENATGREFVVIVEGTAEVTHDGEVINRLGPGDWFGEIALLTGQPRTATVVATSDLHALVIESHHFTQLLDEHPALKAKIAAVAESRLAGLHPHDN